MDHLIFDLSITSQDEIIYIKIFKYFFRYKNTKKTIFKHAFKKYLKNYFN